MGITNPKTVKLWGNVGEAEVVIMIDPGATTNFVLSPLVEKWKLPVEKCGKYRVVLGNGVQGVCKGPKLRVQGLEIMEDFLSLSLGKSDVILGV